MPPCGYCLIVNSSTLSSASEVGVNGCKSFSRPGRLIATSPPLAGTARKVFRTLHNKLFDIVCNKFGHEYLCIDFTMASVYLSIYRLLKTKNLIGYHSRKVPLLRNCRDAICLLVYRCIGRRACRSLSRPCLLSHGRISCTVCIHMTDTYYNLP
jgi:hypothetical protein